MFKNLVLERPTLTCHFELLQSIGVWSFVLLANCCFFLFSFFFSYVGVKIEYKRERKTVNVQSIRLDSRCPMGARFMASFAAEAFPAKMKKQAIQEGK
ncbi:hypothetical protein IMY05_006G0076800 [Salix suchowensis]|nr:hypothetical protein IMY05_006G0076800 [Salix suchowensis]